MDRPLSLDRRTLDGEAAVSGADGVAVFEALHRRLAVPDAVLHAFDLLEFNGKDLRLLPLVARKAMLARVLAGSTAGIVFNVRRRHRVRSMAALDVFETQAIDVVVTDIKLGPGEPHGLALARMIRHTNPKMPVILMTVDPEPIEGESLPGPLLKKPFDFAELGRAIKERSPR